MAYDHRDNAYSLLKIPLRTLFLRGYVMVPVLLGIVILVGQGSPPNLLSGSWEVGPISEGVVEIKITLRNNANGAVFIEPMSRPCVRIGVQNLVVLRDGEPISLKDYLAKPIITFGPNHLKVDKGESTQDRVVFTGLPPDVYDAVCFFQMQLEYQGKRVPCVVALPPLTFDTRPKT